VRLWATVLILIALTNTATAQWGPFGGSCGCQPAIAPAAAAPIFSQTAMANPCVTSTVAVNPCPCVQAIPETVYRDVPVTQYRPEKRTVRKPVVRTEFVEKEVTAYRQIMIPKTVEVPTVEYQTITECKPCTVNRSYWRTIRHPVMKGCACDYDRRPTLLGWLNRQSYEMRMALTPNYINRREFVPNVMTVNVPVQRTVALPSTREVTYNVAKLEPYTTTQKVAHTFTEYIEEEVTAYVPFTTTKTVAVGTRMRMAYVDPFGGGSGTATALNPTPDTREAIRQKSTKSDVKLQGHQEPAPLPIQQPQAQPQQYAPPQQAEPEHFSPFGDTEHGSTNNTSSSARETFTAWRTTREHRSVPRTTSGLTESAVAANQ
jgi:hypothetical protein